MSSFECPICLTLPEGAVHQCHEGHCYCVECWNRLEEPRRCPECRQPVPLANRNRAAERAIAALEASCEHCGEATTRGALAAHFCAASYLPGGGPLLHASPQRLDFCAAAAAGCTWAGMAADQAAHDRGLPLRDLPADDGASAGGVSGAESVRDNAAVRVSGAAGAQPRVAGPNEGTRGGFCGA